jgi:hypothetical protein
MQVRLLNTPLHDALQEIILKRAADLAEALYSMPRNPSGGVSNGSNQLTSATNGTARTPPSSMTGSIGGLTAGNGGGGGGFGPYTSQLAGVAGATTLPPDGTNGQWDGVDAATGWSHRYPAFTF